MQLRLVTIFLVVPAVLAAALPVPQGVLPPNDDPNQIPGLLGVVLGTDQILGGQ
jgi:hypothetical protein